MLDDKAPGNIKLGSLWGYVGVDGNAATALYIYNPRDADRLEGDAMCGT